MKNVVFLKKIAILAFFTLFSGISHLQSMESAEIIAAPSFHTLLETNLSKALTTVTAGQGSPATPHKERAEFAARVKTINDTLVAWKNLPDFMPDGLFDAIFDHMNNVYEMFTKNKIDAVQTRTTDAEQALKNNIIFAQFVRKNWDAFVRACEFIGAENLNPQKILSLLQTINTFGTVATTPALAQYNQNKKSNHTVASLKGEMLVLTTQCYEYFLTSSVNQAESAPFGVNSLVEFQKLFIPTDVGTANVDVAAQYKLALSDLVTIVTKKCIEQDIFTTKQGAPLNAAYEGSIIAVNIDAAVSCLQSIGIHVNAKKLRQERRQVIDSSHNFLNTIVAITPLLLMSTMSAVIAQYCGDAGTSTLWYLQISTAAASFMSRGNATLSTVVRILSWMHPMHLAPLAISSAGHKIIDFFVAKKGSSWPMRWIATKARQAHMAFIVNMVFTAITGYNILNSAYDTTTGILTYLPSLLLGGKIATA